ncbi:MAG: branched-chain amino acid transport system ATP-binding protein livF, partial [Actinomycetota bacterium]|nr:branched-chain amino acid transport system ATP-binding protein livF [Actinomycetota bacterium]
LASTRGTVTFDGRDITHTRAERIARLGLVQAPGGHGVFPSLRVSDNLRLAAWTARDREATQLALADALALFPVLVERAQEPAGNLSGGEQQMLTLAMALVARPRLLMIDELSLGLSPAVLRQLREHLRALRDGGTTIVVVEQSIDLALELADRAYFLEKGAVRFAGPAPELLDHPELVRAVFLGQHVSVDDAHTPVVVEHEPRLEVSGITVRFGGLIALDDVSFRVEPGEILGVLGPNGAGKTTLFDAISGFITPDHGRVQLRDGAVTDLSGAPPYTRARRGLGRSFQDGRLFPALTVFETIAVAREGAVRVRDPLAAALHLPAVARSEAEVRRRVDELIDLLRLGAVAGKFVHELSTGTRRIVDLACVLAHEPTVLLLDEPSSGIAQREAEALAPMLREVRGSLSASLLVIEHDLALLTAISDRLLALDRGRIIAAGAPADVLDDPAVVEAYLGR